MTLRLPILSALVLLALSTLPANATSEAKSVSLDDGTYQTVAVTSTDECAALCKDDLKCRGQIPANAPCALGFTDSPDRA